MHHCYPRLCLRRSTTSGAAMRCPTIVRRPSDYSGISPMAYVLQNSGMDGTIMTNQNYHPLYLHHKQQHQPQVFSRNNGMRLSSSSSSSSFNQNTPNTNGNHRPSHVRPNHQPSSLPSPSSLQNTTGMNCDYNNNEIQKFSKMSNQWWDTKQNPLISMNPIRIRFIQECIQQYYCYCNSNHNTNNDNNNTTSDATNPTSKRKQDNTSPLSSSSSSSLSNNDMSKLKILDIGCGGGLLCESLIRLNIGQQVIGLDPSTSLIQMAQYHAQNTLSTKHHQQLSRLQYYNTTVQDYYHYIHKKSSVISSISKPSTSTLPLDTPSTSSTEIEIDHNNDDDNQFDIICCLEVLEHVSNDQRIDMLHVACQHLLRPNGLLFISTINPTIKSFFVTIVGAEYMTQILPMQTHNWYQFISPFMIRNDFISLFKNATSSLDTSDTTSCDGTTSPPPQPSMQMMERSVMGMVIPITSIPATILFNQWDWQLDPNDTDVNWIGCYQKKSI